MIFIFFRLRIMAKSATMGAAFSKTRRCASYCRQLFFELLHFLHKLK